MSTEKGNCMENEQKGRVYWVTGLSGAGKTTIGKELHLKLSEMKSNIIFFDGDTLREVFGNDLGYTAEDRFRCAMRYARLCHLLAEQRMDVVICTISMFDEVRKWNRENNINYTEIYIKVSTGELIRRNQKNLYSGLERGDTKNVAGMDLQMQLPKCPDIVVENDLMEDTAAIVGRILKELDMD